MEKIEEINFYDEEEEEYIKSEIDYNELADKEEEMFCLEAEFWEYQIWE